MTRSEAVEIVRELLSQRLLALADYPQEPDIRTPASVRRQLRCAGRWREIVAGDEPGPDDLPEILAVIGEELEKRSLDRKIARGPFSGAINEAIAVAAEEWQRYDDARIRLLLPETAAVLMY